MEHSSATAIAFGNVGNGPDGIVGNMDGVAWTDQASTRSSFLIRRSHV